MHQHDRSSRYITMRHHGDTSRWYTIITDDIRSPNTLLPWPSSMMIISSHRIIRYGHRIWWTYAVITHANIWSSYVRAIYDHSVGWSYMIVIYGCHMWSSCIVMRCGDHTWWSYMITIYCGRIWSSYMIIIYDEHIWRSTKTIIYHHTILSWILTTNHHDTKWMCMITIYDHRIWWPYVREDVMYDPRIRSSYTYTKICVHIIMVYRDDISWWYVAMVGYDDRHDISWCSFADFENRFCP